MLRILQAGSEKTVNERKSVSCFYINESDEMPHSVILHNPAASLSSVKHEPSTEQQLMITVTISSSTDYSLKNVLSLKTVRE